jgi:hypothetical protein
MVASNRIIRFLGMCASIANYPLPQPILRRVWY